jgi:hypothetical protein
MATKKPDYWVPFDNHELKEGDWVVHRLYGVCQVTMATPHTLKLLSKKEKTRIDALRSSLTHYWDVRDRANQI